MVSINKTGMKIQDLYLYVFYSFYKIIDSMETEFWNVWRAAALTTAVDVFLFFIISIPLTFLIGYDFLSRELIVVYVIISSVKGYILFDRNDNWKNIVNRFDELPKKTNQRFRRIFWAFLIGLVAILILEFYLMSVFIKH